MYQDFSRCQFAYLQYPIVTGYMCTVFMISASVMLLSSIRVCTAADTVCVITYALSTCTVTQPPARSLCYFTSVQEDVLWTVPISVCTCCLIHCLMFCLCPHHAGEGQSVTSHTTGGGGDSHDPEPSAGEISIFMSSVQVTILIIRISSTPGSP